MNNKFCAILLLTLAACNQSEDALVAEDGAGGVTAAPALIKLSDKDLVRICRGGASFRNGTDVGRIKGRLIENELVRISYTRTDGKYFEYDCKAELDQVRFRMIDEAGKGTGPGEWSGRGSTTTFKIHPGEIEFVDDFPDGSSDTDRVKV